MTGPWRTWAGVGVVLLVVATVVIGTAWAFQRSLIYLPSGDPGVPASAVLDRGEDVRLRTEDGLDLVAWWAPSRTPSRATVLLAPGNAGSRADRTRLTRALTDAGFDVLVLEYRGYGGNPGTPSEEGLVADARAAYEHLVGPRRVEPRRIVLVGESLGGAVTARLATERSVGALVLRSPFTSLADVGARAYPFLPVRLLLRDRFPLLERIAAVRVRVVVVAGGADEVVPTAQSRAVAAASGASFVEVPGARHNDPVLVHGPAVVAAVVGVAPG